MTREEPPERLDLVRLGMIAQYHRGSELVGLGSVGRYRAVTGALDLRVERFAEEGFGLGLAFAVLPPPNGIQDGFFLRGELFAALGVATWEGDVPGSVVLGLGAGGDYVDLGRSDPGRFYGLGRTRLTLWLRRDVTMGLSLESLPLVAAPVQVTQHEHRLELTSSYGFFELGARAAFTFLDGGEPARPFTQQTVGGFVGAAFR